MKGLKEYSIQYKGIGDGVFSFQYELNAAFFEHFENHEIEKPSVSAMVTLEKSGLRMNLCFELTGTITVTCDRCLEELELPIEFDGEYAVKLSDIDEESDDFLCFPEGDPELNVARYLYEFVWLSIPLKKVHDEDETGCTLNPEMLKKLEQYSPESGLLKSRENSDLNDFLKSIN